MLYHWLGLSILCEKRKQQHRMPTLISEQQHSYTRSHRILEDMCVAGSRFQNTKLAQDQAINGRSYAVDVKRRDGEILSCSCVCVSNVWKNACTKIVQHWASSTFCIDDFSALPRSGPFQNCRDWIREINQIAVSKEQIAVVYSKQRSNKATREIFLQHLEF